MVSERLGFAVFCYNATNYCGLFFTKEKYKRDTSYSLVNDSSTLFSLAKILFALVGAES